MRMPMFVTCSSSFFLLLINKKENTKFSRNSRDTQVTCSTLLHGLSIGISASENLATPASTPFATEVKRVGTSRRGSRFRRCSRRRRRRRRAWRPRPRTRTPSPAAKRRRPRSTGSAPGTSPEASGTGMLTWTATKTFSLAVCVCEWRQSLRGREGGRFIQGGG